MAAWFAEEVYGVIPFLVGETFSLSEVYCNW